MERLSEHRLEKAETAEQFRGIALTFDLCPVEKEPGFDEPLVNMLVEHQIPATFFVSGRWAARHEAQLRKLLAVPFFDFGTHGYLHAHLPQLDRQLQRQEIKTAVTLLSEYFGRPTTLFRPPFGEYDELTLKLLDEMGLQFVLWDVVSRDPDSTLSREEIISGVTEQTRPGSIIVFHANGKGQHTKGVIEEVSTALTETLLLLPVTVSELLKHRHGPPFENQKLPPG